MESDLMNVFDPKMMVQKNVVDLLPNEILRNIFVKVDVPKLIAIRGVSRRWQAVIVSICRETRSLVFVSRNVPFHIDHLSNRFNGLDFDKNCAVLKVKEKAEETNWAISLFNDFCNLLAKLFPHAKNLFMKPNVKENNSGISLANDLCDILKKLFPRVHNLAIISSLDCTTITQTNLLALLDYWSSTLITLLLPDHHSIAEHNLVSDHIDQLASLKRLAISSSSLVKPSTLARLEHCSYEVTYDKYGILPHLGQSCTSLYLSRITHIGYIDDWFILNAHLKSLTHLRLCIEKYEEFGSLKIVCSNFSALQMLNIKFQHWMTFNGFLFGFMVRLPNLSQLSIGHFKIDLANLAARKLSFKGSFNLPILNSVRIVKLYDFCFKDDYFDGDIFCQVLSTIFPKLEQLTIVSGLMDRDTISRHSHHFGHLRKHVIIEPY